MGFLQVGHTYPCYPRGLERRDGFLWGFFSVRTRVPGPEGGGQLGPLNLCGADD